jgi:RimJ/RimL family protein N-acetyltransferase
MNLDGTDPGIGSKACELAEMDVFEGCSVADLEPLAALLQPLQVEAGHVLMRQGGPAVSFLLIQSGLAEVRHLSEDGTEIVAEVPAGVIVGEIALLRATPRTATVTSTTPLTGFVGGQDAFAVMAELPGITDRLVRTARQRLAAFAVPIPVFLGDGGALILRPVLPGDSARTSTGPVTFSKETLYRRFMSPSQPSLALMHYLFEVDYVDHFVWVLAEPAGSVVADVRFVRDETDRAMAEVAFIVADDYQGRGIGTFLMDALIIAAHVGGIRRFTARVLTDNLPMRAILDRFGAQWHHEEPGVVTTVFDVPGLDKVKIPPETALHIRDCARQIMRALG